MFSFERLFCLKGDVIDQICLLSLEGQITFKEEWENSTFDAAVAFEFELQ